MNDTAIEFTETELDEISGGPHFRNFHVAAFDFQSGCDTVLAKSTRNQTAAFGDALVIMVDGDIDLSWILGSLPPKSFLWGRNLVILRVPEPVHARVGGNRMHRV